MKEFLFGAVYIIEQDYSDEEMRKDLQNMKDCGFNLITLWPIANAWLAKSSHEWVFQKTRYVLDLCQEMGMKAILQLFGQNQAQEFMPDSAATPEMEYTDQYGPWYNINCMWANLNHPTVRAYFDTYFREAITALRDHPAVYGWDVFNEAHFRSDDPWTVRMYQQWLEHKYGTIENLNYRWYRRYESFYQIRPEMRRAPYSIWSSLLPATEYEKFRSENLTDICRFLYDTAKKYDSVHPIIIDGTSSGIIAEDITMRNNDEFETAFVPDIYGATFYPKSWGRNYKDTPWKLAMYFSIPAGAARGAGKPYIVNELQTHTQSVLTPGSEVSGEELTNWVMMCIFTGLQGMQLWRWRPFLHGYQATGRGLTTMDGVPNKRAFAISKLLGTIQENRELFGAFAVAKPKVQIAFDYNVRLFFDSLLKFGAAGKSFWAENVEGWYQLFWNWGMPAEFVDLSRFQNLEDPAPIMVLPSAISMNAEQTENLRRYVENGGILIADGRMAALDGWGCVPPEGIPGKKLSELFGILEIDVDSGTDMRIHSTRIPTGHQSQILKLVDADAKVLAEMEDGSPAIVQHSYGKGQTLYFNNFEGLVLSEKLWPELQQIIQQVIENVPGVRAEKDEHVHLSYITTQTTEAILAANFANKEETVVLRGLPVGRCLKNIFTGDVCVITEKTQLHIPASGHAVFCYEK